MKKVFLFIFLAFCIKANSQSVALGPSGLKITGDSTFFGGLFGSQVRSAMGYNARFVLQSSVPSDSTLVWIDNSTGNKGVWPLKEKLLGQWTTVRWYDPVLKLVRVERPIYILMTGQSNAIWRSGGGDTARDGRVAYFATGGSWGIAAPVTTNANNIGYQTAKYIAKYKDRIVRFVVVAEPSKPLSDWLPGGLKTVEIANLVREAGIDSFDVILFRQGERNAELNFTENQYAVQMDSVINSYRDSSWFGKSGRVIAGGLNEAYVNTGVFDYYYKLNNGDRGAIGLTGVSTLGLSQAGGIHQDGRTIDSAAYRYFRAWEGMAVQYSLRATPNVGWLSDNELALSPYGTNRPAFRPRYSSQFGRRGAYFKYNDSTSQGEIGYNPINNGTQYDDSTAIFINANSQIGFGKANNTLTTNRSQVQVRSNQPIALTIGSGRDPNKFQFDSTGSAVKPLCFRNMYSRDGNIIFQQLSGDTANGLIRYTRISGPDLNSYRGVYTFFNGATNRFIIGVHPTTDAIWWNDVPILEIDESGNGVGIKLNANPTALLDIAANTSARGQLRYRVGVDPTSPTQGSTWFTSNNLKISDGTTNFTFAKTLTNTATLDFGSTAAGAVSDLTITVTGAADGDAVSVGVPNASTVASGNFTAWVSATNTVTVRYSNNDLTTARDPASGTFRVSVVKY